MIRSPQGLLYGGTCIGCVLDDKVAAVLVDTQRVRDPWLAGARIENETGQKELIEIGLRCSAPCSRGENEHRHANQPNKDARWN